MERLIEFSDGKDTYRVPESESESFKAAMPNARQMSQFVGKDGSRYSVPVDEVESFRTAIPDAESLNRFQLSNGERYAVSQSRMSRFLRSREYREGDADAIAAKRAQIEAETPEAETQNMALAAGEAAVKGAARSVGKIGNAFAGLATGPMRAVGMLFGRDNALVKGADWVDEKLDWFAEDLGVGQTSGDATQDLLSAIGEQGSSMAANIMPWLIPGGAASKIGAKALFAANVAGAGARSAEQMYDQLKANGADDTEAYHGAMAAGAVSTAASFVFGKLSVENYLNGIGARGAAKLIEKEVKSAGRGFNDIVKNVATGRMRQQIASSLVGAEEAGVTTGAEEFVLDTLRQHGSGEEIDFEEALLNALPAAGMAAATGAGMAGIRAGEGKIRRKDYEKAARVEVEAMMNNMAPADLREMNPRAFDTVAKKRAKGGDVSRKDADAVGLPPGWDAARRNEVFDDWNGKAGGRVRPPAELQTKPQQEVADETGSRRNEALAEETAQDGGLSPQGQAEVAAPRPGAGVEAGALVETPASASTVVKGTDNPNGFFRPRTGMPKYDDIVDHIGDKKWLEEQGIDAEIVPMRPDEYIKEAATVLGVDGTGATAEEVQFKLSRNKKTIEKLKSIGKDIDMPMIDFTSRGRSQEGLRRMEAARQTDPDATYPVLVVRDRAKTPVEAASVRPLNEMDATMPPKGTESAETPSRASGEAEAVKAPKSALKVPKTVKAKFADRKKAVKTDPKKAAKVVENFVSKDHTRAPLMKVHHDHERGVAVATDGAMAIITKHGYDPKYKGDENTPYPDWRRIIPDYSKGKHNGQKVESAEIDLDAAETALNRVRSLNHLVGDKAKDPIVYIGRDNIPFSSKKLRSVVSAMRANGITSLKLAGRKSPLLAKNENTTILLMPILHEDDGFKLRLSDGNLVAAPDFDLSARIARGGLDIYEKQISEGRNHAEKTDLFKEVLAAQKRGETDPKSVYEKATSKGAWDKLGDPSKSAFSDWLATKDKDALTDKVARYLWDINPSNRKKDNPWKATEKSKKRIEAYDEIKAWMGNAGDNAEPSAPIKKPTKPRFLNRTDEKAHYEGFSDADTPVRSFDKKSVETTTDEASPRASGGRYRASVASERPLDNPDFKAWAKKRGVAPTQQKREQYDRERVKAATKMLSRWIKGVKVKMVNAISEGGDVRRSIKQEESAKFRNWFGKSKAVDKDGEPIVVYHSSDWNPLSEKDGNAVFDKSKIREGSLGRVFNFSTSPELNYGQNVTKAYLRIEKPFDVANDAGRVLSETESSRFYNALDGEVIGDYRPETLGELFDVFKNEKNFPAAMKALGYDGVVDSKRGYYGVFDSVQIKSATDNIGTYDPQNPDIRYLRDGEKIVGSFNPKTGEVQLAKGASVDTVAHELGWHAAYDWAKKNTGADKRAKKLYDKMREYADNAPDDVKNAVRNLYGVLGGDAFADEVGAALFSREKTKALTDAIATKEGAAWYKKAWNAVVDVVKNFLSARGGNRVDLDGIEKLSPERFSDFLTTAMISGKTLGERKSFSMDLDNSFKAKWERNLSDRFAPIRDLIQRVDGADGEAYRMARTLEGMTQRGRNRAERTMKRVDDILVKSDISPELLGQYMMACAYDERNVKIERRNQTADGSGMTKADADAIFAEVDERGVRAECERAAEILWKMQNEGLQLRVDAGLLDQHTANKWFIDEPHHVPWRDAIDPETNEWMGRNFAGPEFDTAEGRKTSASGDVITFMLQEYENAHARAAENQLRQHLADILRLNGDVGTIYDGIQVDAKGHRSFIKYPQKGVGGTAELLSIPDGAKIESTRRNDGGMQNVLTYRENGETRYLVLNGTLGEAIAGAVTGRSLKRTPAMLSKFMRGYAATATALSPTFAARNTMADHFDIHGNVVKEFGILKGEKAFAKIVKEELKMTKELAKYAHTGTFEMDADGRATTDFGKLIEEYEATGGAIGGLRTEGYDTIQKRIQADFRAGRNKGRSLLRNLGAAWMDLQKMSELSTRLATFKVMKDMGMSAKDAAMWSRESSVDFNKKGFMTPLTNTLWMFSNSALGSSVRQAKGLLTTKGGLQLASGLAAWGFVEGMIESLVNEEYDAEAEKKGTGTGADLNEYTRQNSAYLRFGDKVFRTNMHMGPYGIIKYFGNVAARVVSGKMSAEDAAKELGLTAVEVAAAFSGVGGVSADAIPQTAVPTALQPFVQAATGKDYAGRPMYRTKFDEAKPDSSHGRKSTAAGYKWIAEGINKMTGGDKYRKGSIDIAPETVELIATTIGKNAARDVANFARVGAGLLSGNFAETFSEPRNVPFARDVVRKVDGNENRYYESLRRYDAEKHKLKDPDLKGEERRRFFRERPYLRSSGKRGATRVDALETKINDIRKIEERPGVSEQRREQLKKERRRLQAIVIRLMEES